MAVKNKGQKENVRDLLTFRYHPRQIERDSQANRLRHESEMLRSSGYKKKYKQKSPPGFTKEQNRITASHLALAAAEAS